MLCNQLVFAHQERLKYHLRIFRVIQSFTGRNPFIQFRNRDTQLFGPASQQVDSSRCRGIAVFCISPAKYLPYARTLAHQMPHQTTACCDPVVPHRS